MKTIKVTISKEGEISVFNDGEGIPIQKHKKEGLYIPELVLGHLLTGSNFDDSLSKVTGGRNGYGAKLTNIFSQRFHVETADLRNKKIYSQGWENNMQKIGKPEIREMSEMEEKEHLNFTKITFLPDYHKFGIQNLDDHHLQMMKKRVFDIAAINPQLSVYFNDQKIEMDFEKYFKMFQFKNKASVFERINEKWEIGVGMSENSFFQVALKIQR